jgi:alkanesulfonate monooxygenase SsuD/methylene tetrahydromethanopterin reductase-like flavin-dependent oxidoreductase (luciferase family)
MVTSATFRYPGPLAISVAQVDQMSGGRVELGLGAGWYAAEHAAYAIPFPETPERFDRLEDTLAIVTGLWSAPEGTTFSHAGEADVELGGVACGQRRGTTGAVAADDDRGPRSLGRLGQTGRVRDRVVVSDVETTGAQFERVRAACREVDRDPDSLVYSAAQVVCCGETAQLLDRRADAIGRPPDQLRTDGLAGSPQEVVDKLGRFAELGARRIYLQVLDVHDLDHLEVIAAEVMPHV